MSENITVPKSMLKKMLAQEGMRVSPEVVDKFETLFRGWALEVSKKATQKCIENKRKTLNVSDLD